LEVELRARGTRFARALAALRRRATQRLALLRLVCHGSVRTSDDTDDPALGVSRSVTLYFSTSAATSRGPHPTRCAEKKRAGHHKKCGATRVIRPNAAIFLAHLIDDGTRFR